MISHVILVFLLIPFFLAACGGSKVTKEPDPLVVSKPLATASDKRLSANLDWIIYRDGPGSWAKDVDWDEYLMRVQNLSVEPILVTNVVVFDSTGTRVERGGNLRQLVDATKQTKRRYKDEGLKVNAGAGGLVIAGTAAAGITGVAVGTAAAGYFGATAGAVIGVAAASMVLIPVLAVDGIARATNSNKVNEQIESRQTLFPLVLQDAQERHMDLFFSLAPSPGQINLTYVDSDGEHTLTIDTRAALDGLHLVPVDK
jgi:hypothetical protein